MKKQIYTFAAILISVMVSSVSIVRAQSNSVATAKVPFNFSVGNKTVEAGDCIITRQDDRGTLWTLRSRKGSDTVNLMSAGNNPKSTPSNGKLTFHQYGEIYFLAGIETADYKIKLKRSRAERTAAMNLKRNYNLAKDNAGGALPEIVTVEIPM